MGPVAQRVFKTRAVVQPTARSVRLRRRSVLRRSAADGAPAVAFREGASADVDRLFPGETTMVLRSSGNDQDAEEYGGDRERDEEVPHAHGRNVFGAAVESLPRREAH